MIATLVQVWVKPEFLDQFIKASAINHKQSIKEKGNLRFDILQDASDVTKFVLYEAYESLEAANAHKETEHYKMWRDTVAGFMAKPREGVKHTILYPKK
jgi:(4S)-4-hydroxy-5-phosphonooxypentane-2,3-dione isomerase